MKNVLIFILLVACSEYSLTRAQTTESLAEKPGTFEVLGRKDYTAPECGFSATEVTANLDRIKELVNIIRLNPVLADIKGFNGRARIYNVLCNDIHGYGVPSRISFEFSSFFISKNGTVAFNTIEPPEWSLYLNKVYPIGGGIGSDSFNSRRGYFTAPLRKKNVDSGIDVYDGECWVIYDPSRPPYWLHVTVEEAFEAAREDLKYIEDPVAASFMRQFVENEYAEISEEDRDKPAYFGGNASRISSTHGLPGQDSIFPYIMKVNPLYWDNTLSKAAIQFISFRSVQDKKYLKQLLDECLGYWSKGSGSGCDLRRFELSFGMTDIRSLAPLIGK